MRTAIGCLLGIGIGTLARNGDFPEAIAVAVAFGLTLYMTFNYKK